MAADMFLNINGVKGEAEDAKENNPNHSNEIDVLSWSWGMGNNGSAGAGSKKVDGKVNVQEIEVTKYVDTASPKLMLGCCNGTIYDTALLTVRKPGLEYLKIKMDNVFISAISTGGCGEDSLTETVSLNFLKVNLLYYPQTDKGAAGTPVPFGWDIAANGQP